MRARTVYRPALYLFALGLLLHAAAFARAQSAAPPAQKFDEFSDIPLSDLKARLDSFAVELQTRPDARGFLMVYRSRRDLPGLSSRLGKGMKDYLIYSRGLDAARLVVVDGGEASCLAQELWIVPPGATPTPRADAYQRDFVDLESARRFDNYSVYLPSDLQFTDDSEGWTPDSLDAYAAALRREPRALAYVIAYPQYYVMSVEDDNGRVQRNTYLDPPGTAAKMLRAVKAELVNKHGVAATRVRLVNGGQRKVRGVELWIVPRGEHAPIPTPNAFPKRRAAR